MPTLKLTKTNVAALKAPTGTDKQILYWDPERRGLGVLCSAKTSVKSWVVQGAITGGRSPRITLGPTNVLDPGQAWQKAQPILAQLYNGIDPRAERRRQNRAGATVGQVLEQYLAQSRLSASSIANYRKMAQRHLAPWLNRPIRDISPEDVQHLFDSIVKDIAERRATGGIIGGVNVDGRASANMTMQLFRSLWNFQAERDEALGRNPTIRLRRQWHKLQRRSRHVRSEDLPAFYQAALTLSPMQRDLALLGLFSGMRNDEIEGLKWGEVDFPQKIMRLPSDRMKGDEPFALPMSDFVHDLLVARRAIGDTGVYVFPGIGKTGHTQSFTLALHNVSEATGLKLSPHDLRRTYATIAENTEGVSLGALKRLIAHSTGSGTTDGYVVMGLPDLRRAAQKVCDRMKELCEITAPKADNLARLG